MVSAGWYWGCWGVLEEIVSMALGRYLLFEYFLPRGVGLVPMRASSSHVQPLFAGR